MADQLWLMTRIREEDDWHFYTNIENNVNYYDFSGDA